MAPPIFFISISLIALPVFVFLLWKISARGALIFLGLDFIIAVVSAFFTALNFGGAFGPGIIVFFTACFATPFAALLMAILWIPFARAIARGDARRVVFLIGGIILIVLQSAPIVGKEIIGGYCDAQIMTVGDTIARAAQKYKQAHGDYPRELGALAPNDLPSMARPRCFGSVGEPSSFALERCSDTVTILRTRSFDGVRDLRYNFASGNWSGVSFLDGACNFLR